MFKILFALALSLVWGAARADFNPADPPEPGVPDAAVRHTLTTVALPASGGTVSAHEPKYAEGERVCLQAYPAAGFRFAGWERDAEVVSTDARFYYTMPATDVTLTARFVYDPGSPGEPSQPDMPAYGNVYVECIPQGSADFSIASGTRYVSGERIQITAFPKEGFRFVDWRRGDVTLSVAGTFYYDVAEGDQTLTATLVYDPESPSDPSGDFVRTLTIAQNMLGGHANGGGSYRPGTIVRVATTLFKDYTFDRWTDSEGETVSTETEFDYVMPQKSMTLTANYLYHFNPDSPAEPGEPNPGGSTVIAPDQTVGPRFVMADDDHVLIFCETPGATLYYTLDGSEPTDTGATQYSGPVEVPTNLLVRARAYHPELQPSPIRDFQVRSHRAAMPVAEVHRRLLHLSTSTPGAVIRYTTDWSLPTEESELYAEPFLPVEGTCITAVAFCDGLTPSAELVLPWRSAEWVPDDPSFRVMPLGGLEIIQPDGNDVYYTLDGSQPDPDAGALLYSTMIMCGEGGEPSTPVADFEVRAMAVTEKGFTSQVMSFETSAYQLPAPVASVEDGVCRFDTDPGYAIGARLLVCTDERMWREFNDLIITLLEEYRYGGIEMGEFYDCLENAYSYLPEYRGPIHMGENPWVAALWHSYGMFDSECVIVRHQPEVIELDVVIDRDRLFFISSSPETEVWYSFAEEGDVMRCMPGQPVDLSQWEHGQCTLHAWTQVEGAVNADLQRAFGVSRPEMHLSDDQLVFSCVDSTVEVRIPDYGGYWPDFDPFESIDLRDAPADVVVYAQTYVTGEVNPIVTVPFRKLPEPQLRIEGIVLKADAGYVGDGRLYMCEEEDPYVHGQLVTEESLLLTQRDYLFRAIARGDEYTISSQPVELEFRWMDHIAPMPSLEPLYDEWKVEVNFDGRFQGYQVVAEVVCNISGEPEELQMEIPDVISVEPGFREIAARLTDPSRISFFDSEYESLPVEFLVQPYLHYDGENLYVEFDGAGVPWLRGPGFEGVTDFLRAGDIEMGEYEARGMGSPWKFASLPSIPLNVTFNYDHDRRLGRTSQSGLLRHVLECASHYPGEVDRLYLRGELDGGDVYSLSEGDFGNLQHELEVLDLSESYLQHGLPRAGDSQLTALRRLVLPSLYDCTLAGSLPNLCEVEWKDSRPLPDPEMMPLMPNTLVWVDRSDQAPGYRNVVSREGDGWECASLSLEAGYPFHASYGFTAREARFVKEFWLETPLPGDDGYGWETLVLPFDVEKTLGRSMYSGAMREIVPFAARTHSGIPGYWLRTPSTEDRGGVLRYWETAERIEAGVPYIISMPLNDQYIWDDCTVGQVEFSAADTRIDATPDEEPELPWGRDYVRLRGLWHHPGSYADQCDFKALDSRAGTSRAGGSFTPYAQALPLEAVVIDPDDPSRVIPLAGEGSSLPEFGLAADILIEVSGRALRVTAPREMILSVYDTAGIAAVTLDLKAGVPALTAPLQPGIYFVAGRKVAL